MRVFLIGKNGQLGWELERTLAQLGHVQAVDLPEVDLTHADTWRPLVREMRPQVIVNAAAYTAVDRAETEADLARRVNGVAPGLLAEEAARLGAAFIHYSTDYVFDGCKAAPYLEDDAACPLNVYGCTKLEGERAVEAAGGAYLIVRTSWVYSVRGTGFVSKVMRWLRTQDAVRVAADEVSSPTWARALAQATAQILAAAGPLVVPRIKERRGMYHLAGAGAASRLEWAREIAACDPHPEEHRVREIQPARQVDFATAATRPAYSVLDCSRAEQVLEVRLPEWRKALRQAMEVTETR
jgi:dTDP-4-dehydrorhamnose reductase